MMLTSEEEMEVIRRRDATLAVSVARVIDDGWRSAPMLTEAERQQNLDDYLRSLDGEA